MKYIRKIELEITSKCNAACPGCARTLNADKLTLQSFSLADIKRLFPTKNDIVNREFKFCGVLGDPAVNNECVDMVSYLTSNGAYCELSTNGGYQTADWWHRLGTIASEYPGKVHIHFCVDGHKETNHIYRVNTKFDIIERNMTAYADAAPPSSATWIYIMFDHNEHELDVAKDHAKKLNFDFATRTGMRNSYHDWIAVLKKKQDKKIVEKTQTITTTGAKEHSKVEVVRELDRFIEEYQTSSVDEEKIKAITDSIVCKYVHESEIFIASDLTMWPCCFLWDSAFKNKENILEKLGQFDPEWNSLKKHSIQEVMDHPWYEKLLEASWNPYHNLHLARCIKTCAKNKAYHNEINYIVN